MKAVVYEKFGSPDVLEYREVEKPTVNACMQKVMLK